MTLHKTRQWLRVEREYARRADMFLCHWCGMMHPFSEWTVDHIVPRIHGDNLVISCYDCNAARNVAYWMQVDESRDCDNLSIHRIRRYLEFIADKCPFAKEYGCQSMLERATAKANIVNKKLEKWFLEYQRKVGGRGNETR